MSVTIDQLQLTDFGGSGMRIACRKDTVDEEAIQPWIQWLDKPAPRPGEPSEDATVIDVGAHIGGFTLLASRVASRGRVFAVEACRESYEMLRFNIELNRLTSVNATHLALADRAGEVRLHYDQKGNWGHSITAEHGTPGEQVPAATLHEYMDQRNINRCDLLKLNCEGAEFPILMTTSDSVLRRIQRIIVFYHVDFVNSSYTLKDLEQRLESVGFSIGAREGGRAHGWFTVELMSDR